MNDTDTITGKGSWAKHPILSKDGLWDRITRRTLDETSAAVVREWLTDPDTWRTDTTQGLTAKDAAEALHALADYFESGTPHLHKNGRLACTCPNPPRPCNCVGCQIQRCEIEGNTATPCTGGNQ